MPEPQPEPTPPAGQSRPAEPEQASATTPHPKPEAEQADRTGTGPTAERAGPDHAGRDQAGPDQAGRDQDHRSDHDTPVDPWAAADPEPWAAHVASIASPEPYQPVSPAPPYQPVSPAPPYQPDSPAGPYRSGSPHPPVRAYPTTRPLPADPASARRAASGSPPPAAPPSAPTVKVPEPDRRGRRDRVDPGRGPTAAPPAGWRPPPGYVAVTNRRRRRWPRVMLVLSLLTVVCCCGGPAWFAKPMWEQYPVTATLPTELIDLRKREDRASEQVTDQLRQKMVTNSVLGDTFAGVYTDPSGKVVTIFGTTGFRWNPEQDLDAEMARLGDEYALGEIVPIDTGVRGEFQRCAIGETRGTNVVLCSWADHGSLGTALFTRLSVEDSANLLSRLRSEIITKT
ncbi:hypothetical protein ACI2K4_27155 [Micromonospora sp. NPDC050397]|uniref:hypothetical protein n=1 Tax=Micromonospora sp. NPDC050397 TaxID=3364279 RepID=UPI00384E7A0C